MAGLRIGVLATLLFASSSLCAQTPSKSAASSDRHWSLNPRATPAVPHFEDSAGRTWVRNPVDAFVLTRLRAAQLSPAGEADRPTLLRRVTFDLTGLPPTPAELSAYVNDRDDRALERVVDRLLSSSAYGERWGQHWLDVVRFAETEGFEYDRLHAGAWRYRDYVIESLNRDKPYDQFVREQIAGDELEPENRELQIAAGFHRLGPVRRNAGNQELAFSRHEVLTEMTDIVGTAFLGLTVGCARCHDHMFDEIPQVDYYRLQAFFAATQEHDIVLAPASAQATWKTETDKLRQQIKKLERALPGLTGAARAAAEQELRVCERKLPPPLPTVNSVQNVASQRTPVHLLFRGNTDRPGRLVGPRFLTLLDRPDSSEQKAGELPVDLPQPKTSLARWLTRPDHPLTARVIVNRIWQRHFGRGLVETPNDFGVNGREPTHPELLDWLANDFVAGGWKLKRLHRLIVLSSVYRQSSRPVDPAASEKRDADNRLLSHFSRRRLSAEEIRDAMLLASGQLNRKAGGPSVIVPVDSDLVQLLYEPSQWAVNANQHEHDRRSIYLIAKRNLKLPFLEMFDQPDAQTSCARRESSTHALQALELLNGSLSNRLALAFAKRLTTDGAADPGRQVQQVCELAIGRTATVREQAIGCEFLRTQPLSEFCLAIFNWNAFLYVD